MPNLGATEVILILLVLILLFGAKKLPDTARGLGRSLRIFKAETKGLRDDDKTDADIAGPTPRATPVHQLEPGRDDVTVRPTPAPERRPDDL
jgi:sec-independent protein translocase protein TatA